MLLRVAYAIMLVMMACNACMWTAGLESIQNALQQYVLYNNTKTMCEDICIHEQGYALQSQLNCYSVGDQVVVLGNAGDGVLTPESVACNDSMTLMEVLH